MTQKVLNVLVALDFDEHQQATLQSAVALAQHRGARLRLLHVCRPLDGHSYLLPYFAQADREQFEQYLSKSAIELASQRLSGLVKSLPNAVEAEVHAFSGDPTSVLLAESALHRCDLMVVGSGRAESRFLPRGLSTALSLIQESSVPILIVDGKHPLKLEEGKALRAVIADDLSEESCYTVQSALKLLYGIGNTDVHHVHVSGVDEKTISATMQLSKGRFGSLSLPGDGSAGAFLSAIEDRQKAQLAKRASVVNEEDFYRSGCTYHQVIRHGQASEEILKYVNEKDPQLVIFGRHRFFHRKAMAFGKVPWHSMLKQNRPVLIVPSS